MSSLNELTEDNDINKLTENDFRFSKIKHYRKAPTVHKDQLLVNIAKSDPVYKTFSSFYHRAYINHDIPEIPNSSPTLAQFWQELKVYRYDLQDMSHEIPFKDRPPKQSFFENANLNFATATNARIYKYRGLVPIYYYYFNKEKNKAEYLSIKDAKRIFCKKYEKDIMENEESRLMFMLLLSQCKSRNKDYPIIIRGYEVVENMESTTCLKNIFEDKKLDFGCEYCLVEMLINYPNLNECIWNR